MTSCRVCNSVNIEAMSAPETFKYKNKDLQVEIEYSICADCGEEFIDKDQIDENDLRLRVAKRAADGLLSPQEVLEARKELGLTQEEASKVFGGGVNAFSKYERGDSTQSVAMDKLIRVGLRDRHLFKSFLLPLAGLKPRESIEYPFFLDILPKVWASVSVAEPPAVYRTQKTTHSVQVRNGRKVVRWKNESYRKRVA